MTAWVRRAWMALCDFYWWFVPSKRHEHELESEVERLEGLLHGFIDPKLLHVDASQGGVLELVMRTPVVELWAAFASEQFRISNALNYVSWRFTNGHDAHTYELVCQRVAGLTPAEKAAAFEEVIKKLTDDLHVTALDLLAERQRSIHLLVQLHKPVLDMLKAEGD